MQAATIKLFLPTGDLPSPRLPPSKNYGATGLRDKGDGDSRGVRKLMVGGCQLMGRFPMSGKMSRKSSRVWKNLFQCLENKRSAGSACLDEGLK